MHVSCSVSLIFLLECCLAFFKLYFFAVLLFDSFFPNFFNYFFNRLFERITNTYPGGANSRAKETNTQRLDGTIQWSQREMNRHMVL